MIFKKRWKELSKSELERIHLLLSKLYTGSKFKKTELDDALFLRMRVATVLKIS